MQRRYAVLALVTAWALFFLPELLASGAPFYRDVLVTNLPVREYARERLLHGELPQWFPFEGLGMPFIGQLVTQTFHPLTWMLLPLPGPVAMKAMLLGAPLLALGASYRFARAFSLPREAALAAAFAYAFGGYAVGVSCNTVYALSHATLPLVAFAAWKAAFKGRARDIPLLAVACGLVLLSGDAQNFVLTAPLVVAVAAVARRVPGAAPGRTPWLFLAAGGALGAALGAAELLPAIAVSAASARREASLAASAGAQWSLSPLRLPELLIAGWIPDVVRHRLVREFLREDRTSLWATTITAGATAMVLAAAGAKAKLREQWPFLLLAAVASWLALGPHGGLWTLAWAVPPFHWFRYPEKYLSLAWVAAVPLVAAGGAAVAARPRAWLVPFVALGGGLLAATALAKSPAVVAAVLGARAPTLGNDLQVVSAVSAAWSRGALIAGAALLASAALVAANRALPWAPRTIACVVFAELLLANGAHVPLVDGEILTEPTAFGQALAARAATAGPGRVLSLADVRVPLAVSFDTGEAWVRATRRALGATAASLEHVASVKPNLPLVPARLAAVMSALRQTPHLATRYHVCFATFHVDAPTRAEPISVDETVGMKLVPFPCRPRAFLGEARAVPNMQEAEKRLREEQTSATWWEGNVNRAAAAGTVRWLAAAPEHLALEVQADADAALVLADQFATGWSATVDGADVPIAPVDLALRGVLVPAGVHRVEFRYRAPGLTPGLWVTAFAWLAVAALALAPLCLRARRQRVVVT